MTKAPVNAHCESEEVIAQREEKRGVLVDELRTSAATWTRAAASAQRLSSTYDYVRVLSIPASRAHSSS